jgi:hypothetical protein
VELQQKESLLMDHHQFFQQLQVQVVVEAE